MATPSPTQATPVSGPGARLLNRSPAWLLVLIALTLLLFVTYADGIAFVVRRFAEPEYSHGYLIPFITAFFLWNRRTAILAEREPGSWWGIVLVIVGALLLLFGEFAYIQRLAWLSLPIMLIGLGIAAVGWWPMRRAWLPIAFLWSATPLPGSIHVMLSTDLQLISSKVGAAMLDALNIPVFVEGNIIDLGTYQLQVAEACSGLRYLFPLLAFAFLTSWLMRAPLWARGLVLLSAIPITVALNSFRIAMTGVFVSTGNTALADGFMHLLEGWVVFLIAIAILFAEMYVLCRLTGTRVGVLDCLDFDRINGPAPAPRPRAVATTGRSAVPAALVAGLVVLIGVNAGKAFSDERTQIIPERPPLAQFPLVLGDWIGQWDYVEPRVLRSLGATDQLLVNYATASTAPPVNLWIAYYAEQIREAAIHSPKDCLPGGGWEYAEIHPAEAPVRRLDGNPFQLNRAIIVNGGQQMLVYYWVDIRGRQLTNEFYLKLWNLWDSFAMRRSDGALIRLVTPIDANETVEAADARLSSFLELAYPHMLPHIDL